MRKFIGSIVVILVVVAAVGYYRGWFGIPSGHSSSDNKEINVTLPVDKQKISDDAAAAKQKAGEISDKIKERVNDQKPGPSDK